MLQNDVEVTAKRNSSKEFKLVTSVSKLESERDRAGRLYFTKSYLVLSASWMAWFL